MPRGIDTGAHPGRQVDQNAMRARIDARRARLNPSPVKETHIFDEGSGTFIDPSHTPAQRRAMAAWAHDDERYLGDGVV